MGDENNTCSQHLMSDYELPSTGFKDFHRLSFCPNENPIMAGTIITAIFQVK